MQILQEYDRLYPDSGTKNFSQLWESLIPTIFQMAEHETSNGHKLLMYTLSSLTLRFPCLINDLPTSAHACCNKLLPFALAALYIAYTLISLCAQATANVKTTAESAFSPQPSIIVRATPERKIKDAFLVIQRAPFAATVQPKLFTFNVHYPDGCTNF